MATIITVQGNQLEVLVGTAKSKYVNMDDCDLAVRGTNVIVNDASTNDKLVDAPFGDFTPSGGSAQAVCRAIAALMSGAAGAGVSVGADPSIAGAPTTVSVDTSNTLILAANADRVEGIIRNDDADPLFIQEGANATLSSVIKLEQDDTYFVNNTLIVNGIRAVATANAQVTEKTK